MVIAAWRRRASWVAIAAILVAAPACGPDGFTAPWLRGPNVASPYVVNRPAYADGARPFFISGYAGANYEPLGARPVYGVPGPAPVRAPVLTPEPPPAPPAGPPAVTVSEGSWQTE
ncbi:MAG: hypothetical protein ACLQIB_37695 [Isosphaeraceae bacterium]